MEEQEKFDYYPFSHLQHYRTFSSKISKFQEFPDTTETIWVWVKDNPEWLPKDQHLIIDTRNFNFDTLKTVYYYPGKIFFKVCLDSYDILDMDCVYEEKSKCVLL